MSNLAIIPARGGSKRIPKKNLKNFCGRPIICYSISLALQSGLFNEIMVSTDDEAIASLALNEGIKVPFLRSLKNSDDNSTLTDVIIEVLSHYLAAGKSFENICLLLPTAPLAKEQHLVESFKLLAGGGYSSVVPIVQYSYPVQRAFTRDNDGRLSMMHPENKFVRSQDLQASFHDAGQYYWIKTTPFLKEKSIFMESTGSFVLDEMFVQDIDTETDWHIAEMKFQYNNI